jgi:RNA polymerase sigma-70 factor (ECF subfamily)
MRPDPELVSAVAAGDMEALRELFQRHHHDVLNVVFPIVGTQGLAEDITQETFLALLEHAGDYSGQGRFKGWLYRIAVNLALMELRRRKKPIPEQREIESPDATAERGDLQDLVLSALRELPDDQRAAVSLRKVRGLSVDECAQILECDPGTVKSRVFYGLQKMRQTLISMGVRDGAH